MPRIQREVGTAHVELTAPQPEAAPAAPAPAAAPAAAAPKTNGKKPEPKYKCGFCSSAPIVDSGAVAVRAGYDPHDSCPGVMVKGNGESQRCSCPCNIHRCLECGARDTELNASSICVDGSACADRIYHKALQIEEKNAPLRKMLAECAEQGAIAAAETNRAKRERRMQLAAEQAGLDDQVAEVQAAPKSTPAAGGRRRVKGTPQPCHCGCGETTKGGQFAMGHDQRHKGVLFRLARSIHDASLTELPTDVVNAAAEVVAHGWSQKGIAPNVLAAAESMLEAEGYDAVVERLVKERYARG